MVGPHACGLGRSGTGKTTFAQLLVDLWDAIGLWTAQDMPRRRAQTGSASTRTFDAKAKRLIEGHDVIFVDEAYSLVNGRSGDDMYGQEVLSKLWRP